MTLAALDTASPIAARAYNLEHDVSHRLVEIRADFRGAEIVFFGTANLGEGETEDGEPAASPDVILVVQGPPQTVAIRRKKRVNGIWINSENVLAREVPCFYFLASTRPLNEMADEELLRRYSIGPEHIGMVIDRPGTVAPAELPETAPAENTPAAAASAQEGEAAGLPSAGDDAVADETFSEALVRLLEERGAVVDQEGELRFVRNQLFRADVRLPATVPLGAYEAKVYLLKDGYVLDAQVSVIYIDKKGLELAIYQLAQRNPILYGMASVLIAGLLGLGAAWAFRRL